MEIILAIVWYLALLMPGNTYTQDDVYDIALTNHQAVDYVWQNELSQALTHSTILPPDAPGGVFLPGVWDKEPVDHTDYTLRRPGDNYKRRDTTGGK